LNHTSDGEAAVILFGCKKYNALLAAGEKHPIEKTGAELRSMMPWISAGKAKVADISGG
jgi:ketol-acid reductoisomerase